MLGTERYATQNDVLLDGIARCTIRFWSKHLNVGVFEKLNLHYSELVITWNHCEDTMVINDVLRRGEGPSLFF